MNKNIILNSKGDILRPSILKKPIGLKLFSVQPDLKKTFDLNVSIKSLV